MSGQGNFALQNIETPMNHDVLGGRGGASYRHHGNMTYRKLVQLNKPKYALCQKIEKMKISKSIVQAIRSQDPPGRFLEKTRKTGLWNDIGDKKAIEKTSQALREGQPDIRKSIEELQATANNMPLLSRMNSGSSSNSGSTRNSFASINTQHSQMGDPIGNMNHFAMRRLPMGLTSSMSSTSTNGTTHAIMSEVLRCRPPTTNHSGNAHNMNQISHINTHPNQISHINTHPNQISFPLPLQQGVMSLNDNTMLLPPGLSPSVQAAAINVSTSQFALHRGSMQYINSNNGLPSTSITTSSNNGCKASRPSPVISDSPDQLLRNRDSDKDTGDKGADKSAVGFSENQYVDNGSLDESVDNGSLDESVDNGSLEQSVDNGSLDGSNNDDSEDQSSDDESTDTSVEGTCKHKSTEEETTCKSEGDEDEASHHALFKNFVQHHIYSKDEAPVKQPRSISPIPPKPPNDRKPMNSILKKESSYRRIIPDVANRRESLKKERSSTSVGTFSVDSSFDSNSIRPSIFKQMSARSKRNESAFRNSMVSQITDPFSMMELDVDFEEYDKINDALEDEYPNNNNKVKLVFDDQDEAEELAEAQSAAMEPSPFHFSNETSNRNNLNASNSVDDAWDQFARRNVPSRSSFYSTSNSSDAMTEFSAISEESGRTMDLSGTGSTFSYDDT